MRALTLCLALVALSGPALAQEREPALRQALIDLAYVIGESHALRQVCEGAEDQFWRTRMIKLVETEQPDAALDRRLKESFNTGFATRQGEFTECGGPSREAAQSTAARGRDLAAKLAKAVTTVRPAPAAEDLPIPAH